MSKNKKCYCGEEFANDAFYLSHARYCPEYAKHNKPSSPPPSPSLTESPTAFPVLPPPGEADITAAPLPAAGFMGEAALKVAMDKAKMARDVVAQAREAELVALGGFLDGEQWGESPVKELFAAQMSGNLEADADLARAIMELKMNVRIPISMCPAQISVLRDNTEMYLRVCGHKDGAWFYVEKVEFLR